MDRPSRAAAGGLMRFSLRCRDNGAERRERCFTNGETEEWSKNGGGSTAGPRSRPADADGSDRKPRTEPDSRCSWFSIRFVRVRRVATPSNRCAQFVLCFLRSSVCGTVISAVYVSSMARCSKLQSVLDDGLADVCRLPAARED